jgi:hypothetical protein
MRLHEREKIVREAELALSEKLLEWMQEYSDKLTFGEELRVISKELGGTVSRMAKYEIRRERHGDDSKPGGLADG